MWPDAQDFYTPAVEDKTHQQENRKPANQFIGKLQDNETHTTKFAELKSVNHKAEISALNMRIMRWGQMTKFPNYAGWLDWLVVCGEGLH